MWSFKLLVLYISLPPFLKHFKTRVHTPGTLKGLSYEIDFENVDENLKDLGLNKGRGWFLNFSEAPLIFG